MIEIRWLLRGSSRVLQYRKWTPKKTEVEFPYAVWEWSDWRDVPEMEVSGG